MQEILNLITHQEEWKYSDIVKEYLLIKTWFIKDKEYVITENSHVSQVMQIKV